MNPGDPTGARKKPWQDARIMQCRAQLSSALGGLPVRRSALKISEWGGQNVTTILRPVHKNAEICSYWAENMETAKREENKRKAFIYVSLQLLGLESMSYPKSRGSNHFHFRQSVCPLLSAR